MKLLTAFASAQSFELSGFSECLTSVGNAAGPDNAQQAMNLVSLNLDTIPLGQPLPFVLRSADGALLAQKGYVIRNREDLDVLLARGVSLCVDTDESGESHRAYLAQLQRMIMSGNSLGEIASVKITAAGVATRDRSDRAEDWSELQLRSTQLLRAPSEADFMLKVSDLLEDLLHRCETAPDATLLALIHLSAEETRMYSATHAMLVSCVCMVVAKEMLRWPRLKLLQLGGAALTMNVSMTELQDQLAQQGHPLTSRQIAVVEDHAIQSEAVLAKLGITDPVWLEAVRCHHHRIPGAMADKTVPQQMARLIHRADIFAARLAPRVTRVPMPVTAAMQASYYDEERQVDEAGAALVKALGIYPPGAYVRLASLEVAVVLRRGTTATTPRVAVVMNREGMPTGELISRDTNQPAWKITGVVSRKELRVHVPLDRLLAAK